MVFDLILIVLLIAAIAAIVMFAWVPRADQKGLTKAHHGAEIMAGIVTAVGIVTAGLLYVMEKQWSPRLAVDITANTHLLPDTEPGKAIIQAKFSITNQGRTSQAVRNIEVGAVEIIHASLPDASGDMIGKEIFHFMGKSKQIGPGETDLGFVEVPVSCGRALVRVIVKVPQPPFNPAIPAGQRPVYERKVLVPVKADCKRLAATTDKVSG